MEYNVWSESLQSFLILWYIGIAKRHHSQRNLLIRHAANVLHLVFQTIFAYLASVWNSMSKLQVMIWLVASMWKSIVWCQLKISNHSKTWSRWNSVILVDIVMPTWYFEFMISVAIGSNKNACPNTYVLCWLPKYGIVLMSSYMINITQRCTCFLLKWEIIMCLQVG